MRLPNGQRVLQVNAAETSLQYRNIYVDREYTRQGIHLGPAAVVLDIGANIGIASLFFHSQCADAQIFAFEPAELLFGALRANLAEAGANARAFQQAVGAKPGTATLAVYPRTTAMNSMYADADYDREVTRIFLRNCGLTEADVEDMVSDRYTSFTQECEVTTVSAVLAQAGLDRVDLLKINVEKAESDVLAGIRGDDWPKIRQIVMQVHDIDGRVERIRRDLTERGFVVSTRQEPLLHGTDIYDLAARRAGCVS
jgi:31-O-methyltransferase